MRSFLVVGSGIAGLSAAYFLSKSPNNKVEILDTNSDFESKKMYVTLLGRGRSILNEIGGYDHIALPKATIINSLKVRNDDGRTLKETKRFHHGSEPLILDKNIVRNFLLNSVSHIDIEKGKILSIKVVEDRVAVTTDKESREYDYIVVANGSKSDTHKIINPHHKLPEKNKWAMAQFKVASDTKDTNEISFVFIDDNILLMIFPETANQRLISIFAPEEKLINFNDLKLYLAKKASNKPYLQYIFSTYRNEYSTFSFFKGSNYESKNNRVILLGDAKHTITPVTGMGMSLALEEAKLLGTAFDGPEGGTDVFNSMVSKEVEPLISTIHKFEKLFLSAIKPFNRELIFQLVPKTYFQTKINHLIGSNSV